MSKNIAIVVLIVLCLLISFYAAIQHNEVKKQMQIGIEQARAAHECDEKYQRLAKTLEARDKELRAINQELQMAVEKARDIRNQSSKTKR
ncbi:MAG: hypothetical protein ACK514_02370 [Bacteroidota bacterium]|jgi:hypothetical protein|nr:hypothetical protein [Cytophagales bacterium]